MIAEDFNDAASGDLATATLLDHASEFILERRQARDTAIETADIALMTDDLSRLPWLIGHSRRTLGIIRQNIAFALGVKVVFVTLTFAGFATLWGAIAAEVGASLLVVANALRLLRSRARWECLTPMLESAAAEHMMHGH